MPPPLKRANFLSNSLNQAVTVLHPIRVILCTAFSASTASTAAT